ncbi:MAG TPA: 3D domain-containing protein, partial [Gaiellaceae bacterium]|nr:3D domain-containing protein [Gaiellaceae bacterium]
LYSIDEHLARAQAKLGSLQAQAAQLRSEQALLTEQLAINEKNLVVSQQMLGANIRMLYEQGQADPLAVVFGASSLDDAVTKLDDLSHVAQQSKLIVDATTAARHRVVLLRNAVARERAQIDAALTAARQTANTLAGTRTSRISYVSHLRSQQRLRAAQIATIEATAQHAEAKSQAIVATTPAAAPAPAPASAPTLSDGRTITVSSTGYSLPGRTATGLPVGWGIVSVDPSVIPLGTKMTIPGYGEGVAADVGSAVRGYDIDLWFPTLGQALAWGRRTVTITLHG